MPKREHIYKLVIAVLLLAIGWGVMASANRRSKESDLAAPGAMLYENALNESVKSLMSKQEQAALDEQGRPPSPGPDYYWCEKCKTYHKRKTPASPGQQQAGQTPGTAPSSPRQPGAAAAVSPPSPGPDYYWCEKCKTYHIRKVVPNQPEAATPAPHETPAAVPEVDTRPPSPGEGYYWCEKCKTYHRRQPAANLTPILGGESNSPNRNPLATP